MVAQLVLKNLSLWYVAMVLRAVKYCAVASSRSQKPTGCRSHVLCVQAEVPVLTAMQLHSVNKSLHPINLSSMVVVHA
jgi:hypothetical protein